MSQVLAGKVAIITGGNQGLGLEIARKYVQAGARVTICARDDRLLNAAAEELRKLSGTADTVLSCVADVSREADVTALIVAAKECFDRIDILVNNAGIYGPKGEVEAVDWAEWVRALEINLFGSVLMARGVLPLFKAQKHGKIIQLSGGGATKPLPRLSAYAVSKAAIVRFVETLAAETRDDHIDVNAIAPGALNTRMLDEILAAGVEKAGPAMYRQALKQKASGGTPLAKAANLTVFLGSAASDGITGKLIAAEWDPWAKLPQHLQELNSTDIYTLRRIVPSDRGMSWGDDL